MTASEIFRDKEKFINEKLKLFEKDIYRLQNELWELIAAEYIPDFNITQDGNIALTNLSRAAQLDAIFRQFDEEFQKSVFKNFANNLLDLTDFSKRQFAQDFKKSTIDKISQQTGVLSKYLGISKSGELIGGSYLDRLAEAPEVRNKLKNYVINQVSVKTNLKDFQKGFKDLVIGNSSRGITGSLVKYHSQFSYDTFSQFAQLSDNYYADQLGLNYFIYEGTLIKTSRCFCIKRAGKVFNVEDTQQWKNDPHLLGDPNTYAPMVERGRWNCRHLMRFVSKELAIDMGYDKKQANEILKQGCAKKKK